MSKTSESTGVIFGVKFQMMRHFFVICKHFEVVFHKKNIHDILVRYAMHTLFLSKLLLRLYKIDSSPRSLVPSCGRIFRRFFQQLLMQHSAILGILIFLTWLSLCVGWPAMHCKSIHNSNQQRDDEEERPHLRIYLLKFRKLS